jgi:HAD superfamily hydrolase (TIGR01509 family)
VIRGVLFDLDGTLADTERLQWQAYRRVLLDYGVDVGLEEYRVRWIAVDGGPEYACSTYALPFGPLELRARKTAVYRTLIRGGVQPMPGARAALERLRPTHRLALATNTVRDEVGVILGHLGMGTLLHATIAREDYDRPKPAPDAYLAAAAALGLTPAECVVVEDTQRGLTSGLAAEMAVIAVPSDLTRDNDFTGAAAVLPSLDELTPALLARIAVI